MGSIESNEPKKPFEISSSKGITLRDGERKFLIIPNKLVDNLVVGRKRGRDAINSLHEQVYDGSRYMWGNQDGTHFMIELGSSYPIEKAQELVDKIEAANNQ
ncbi:MAG: hypothetical protein WCT16_01680 [Candidatus Buchananbacteria bacterium]